MQLVAVLQELWLHRVLVVPVVLISLLAGGATAYRITLPADVESRQYELGIASVRALVDTPSSQVVNLGGDTGTDIASLSARASLLASLLTSAPIKDQIAKRAGLTPRALVTPATTAAAQADDITDAYVTAADPRAHTLSASVPTLEKGQLPMIYVETQAPDAEQAARLADHAIAQLKTHLSTVAAEERLPEARRLVITQLGPARSATVRRGPGLAKAIFIAILVCGLGLGSILGTTWLVRAWRLAPTRAPAGEDLAEPDDADTGPAAAHEFPDWLSEVDAVGDRAPRERRAAGQAGS